MTPDFIATRAAGLARMQAFVPAMGQRYAIGRNYDHGPGHHDDVSRLSPYIRRRLVTEHEVASAAVTAHGPAGADRFIQEILWRGYFKGWLERRPQVWDSYVTGRDADLAALDRDSRLRRAFDSAVTGRTGLACFDGWQAELVTTGYLHNHARMWFASIWIFTFGLPWRLGADFFYRHLLDGDAASNTLSWRWVAGLHTRGRPYPALADNIATFTKGRFTPRPTDLAKVTAGLDATEPDGLPPVQPLRAFTPPAAGCPTALLLTDDDCMVSDFDLAALDLRATATLSAAALRSPLPVADAVLAAEKQALACTATRLGQTPTALRTDDPDSLVRWAAAAGARQIALPYATRGPLKDLLTAAAPLLHLQGIQLTEYQRDWDAVIWPHATAGFFKVKKQTPRILARLVQA